MKEKRDARQLPGDDVKGDIKNDIKDTEKPTLYKRLHLLSFSKGLLIALVLIAISVPIGNRKALTSRLEAAQRVWHGLEVDSKPIPENQRVSIEQLLKSCADAAANLITLMKNYPDAAVAERTALERARDAMRAAGNPASAVRADYDLFVCFQNAMDALLDQAHITGEEFELLDGVVASFNAGRRQLALRARDYDRQQQKAIDTYNELPARALFAKPELYETMAAAAKEGTT